MEIVDELDVKPRPIYLRKQKEQFKAFQERFFGESITRLVELLHDGAKKAGWWNDVETGAPLERNKGELIALMHSELSEALEGIRKDAQDDHLPHRKSEEVELADCIIRILDYCGAHNLDIGGAVMEKFSYNMTRQDHKPGNRAKDGGKKF
jgi:NTP pyrophosphatase (non-canonical NTP hydrolase)